MEIIGEYEDEFNELAKSIKKSLKEIKASEDESEKEELGNKISSDLSSLVDTYDQMKREFRSLDPKAKGQWKSKLTEYEEIMKNLKTRCNRIVNTASKNQLYGKRGGKNADRQRLADSTTELQQGNDLLTDAIRTAQEAEEGGLGIISELDVQNKKLLNSKSNAIRVKDNADTARSILTRMYKRNIYMKLVIWFMILALVAGIVCFIYFVFIK